MQIVSKKNGLILVAVFLVVSQTLAGQSLDGFSEFYEKVSASKDDLKDVDESVKLTEVTDVVQPSEVQNVVADEPVKVDDSNIENLSASPSTKAPEVVLKKDQNAAAELTENSKPVQQDALPNKTLVVSQKLTEPINAVPNAEVESVPVQTESTQANDNAAVLDKTLKNNQKIIRDQRVTVSWLSKENALKFGLGAIALVTIGYTTYVLYKNGSFKKLANAMKKHPYISIVAGASTVYCTILALVDTGYLPEQYGKLPFGWEIKNGFHVPFIAQLRNYFYPALAK